MRIAIVSPFNPVEIKDYITDGSQVCPIPVVASSVHSTVRGYLKMGHHVSVFTSCVGPIDAIKENHGENAHIYIVQNRHSLYGLRTYPKLRKLIRQHLSEFDVLHAQWTYEYAYAIVPFASRIPCFCSVRDWCPYLMKLSKTLRGRFRIQILFHYFRKVMNTNAIVKISNSSYIRQRIMDYTHIDKIPFIPNPIKSELIMDRHVDKNEKVVFITICQNLCDGRKNISTLIKAFMLLKQKYPNIVLKLIGEGSHHDFIDILDLDDYTHNIEYLGKISHDEVIKQIDQATCLVHPAFEETFGNIFLEASARGIPSIGGHDAGAVPQVLEYGRAGCLCDVHNIQSLYNAMQCIIEDTSYREYITENAITKVRREYVDYVVCQKQIELYYQYIS